MVFYLTFSWGDKNGDHMSIIARSYLHKLYITMQCDIFRIKSFPSSQWIMIQSLILKVFFFSSCVYVVISNVDTKQIITELCSCFRTTYWGILSDCVRCLTVAKLYS